MEILILAVVLALSLLMIPLGLPGLWIMVASGVAYRLLVPGSVSIVTLVLVIAIALVAEVLEFTLAGKYAKRYGGSRRAGWGAIIGGTVGAFVGLPVPIVGPMLGAFAGAFVGALVAELSRGETARASGRVAFGALLGRVVSAALKTVAGVVIAAWVLMDAWM
jgi:uncharacterized protein YqgC (DUF456 family)